MSRSKKSTAITKANGPRKQTGHDWTPNMPEGCEFRASSLANFTYNIKCIDTRTTPIPEDITGIIGQKRASGKSGKIMNDDVNKMVGMKNICPLCTAASAYNPSTQLNQGTNAITCIRAHICSHIVCAMKETTDSDLQKHHTVIIKFAKLIRLANPDTNFAFCEPKVYNQMLGYLLPTKVTENNVTTITPTCFILMPSVIGKEDALVLALPEPLPPTKRIANRVTVAMAAQIAHKEQRDALDAFMLNQPEWLMEENRVNNMEINRFMQADSTHPVFQKITEEEHRRNMQNLANKGRDFVYGSTTYVCLPSLDTIPAVATAVRQDTVMEECEVYSDSDSDGGDGSYETDHGCIVLD